ncbi:10 kDa heat shock protein, mitochondrial-like isoform X2 [Ptychodera flava]|uniref:10 kDa heat shock protein, mitochondrial-like isoform X2 n=1 Tax=Ptychodera flava TaxID=63121 RepID=UPI003969FA1A
MGFSGHSVLRRFKPLLDRVLVERFAPEVRTKGGIMLPEKAIGKVLDAKVVAVGPGIRNEAGSLLPMSVNVGDRVLLPEYGGTKITLDEKEYHLFRDGDILAKYEGESS